MFIEGLSVPDTVLGGLHALSYSTNKKLRFRKVKKFPHDYTAKTW